MWPSLTPSLRVTQTIRSPSGQYPNRFQCQTFTHIADAKGKNIENKGNGVDKEFSKLTPIIKCYKCQGYGHVAANCPTLVKITLLNGEPEVVSESESESEEFIFQREEEESDMDDDTTGDSITLNCIQLTTSIHLSVVRCALSQLKEKDDWRRTTMFHIIMRLVVEAVR